MDLTVRSVAPAITWLLVSTTLGPIAMPVPAPTALWYAILVSMSTIAGPTCPTADRASRGGGGIDGDAWTGAAPRPSAATAVRLSSHGDHRGLRRCASLIPLPPA